MDDKIDIRQPLPTAAVAPAQPVAAIPETIEERALLLAGLMEKITAQLERETAFLQTNQRGELSALVAEKQGMMAQAEEMGRLLRIDREGLFSLPPEIDTRLRAANRALQKAVDENIETLQRSIGAQRLLVGIVVDTVNRGRQSEQAVYTPPAGYPARARGRSYAAASGATSAAINTRI